MAISENPGQWQCHRRRRHLEYHPVAFPSFDQGSLFSSYHIIVTYTTISSFPGEKERCQIMPHTGDATAIIMPTPIPIRNLDMLPASPGSFHLHHRSRNAAASSSKHQGSSAGKNQAGKLRDMDGLPTSTGTARARGGGGNAVSRSYKPRISRSSGDSSPERPVSRSGNGTPIHHHHHHHHGHHGHQKPRSFSSRPSTSRPSFDRFNNNGSINHSTTLADTLNTSTIAPRPGYKRGETGTSAQADIDLDSDLDLDLDLDTNLAMNMDMDLSAGYDRDRSTRGARWGKARHGRWNRGEESESSTSAEEEVGVGVGVGGEDEGRVGTRGRVGVGVGVGLDEDAGGRRR